MLCGLEYGNPARSNASRKITRIGFDLQDSAKSPGQKSRGYPHAREWPTLEQWNPSRKRIRMESGLFGCSEPRDVRSSLTNEVAEHLIGPRRSADNELTPVGVTRLDQEAE